MTPDILTLLDQLSQAGIWIHLSAVDRLTIGPDALVHRHPALLEQLRAHKPAVIHAIKSMQAHAWFSLEKDDPRFFTGVCQHCHQEVYVITSPRRLSIHRLPDGKTVCPGSEQAQLATAEAILAAFIVDRCLLRPGALLTWTSLRSALLAWCAAREFWLPPPQYLQQWLAAQYPEHAARGEHHPLGPIYEGLSLRQEEWMGDQENPPRPVQASAAPVSPAPVKTPVKKGVLVATGPGPKQENLL